LHLGFEVDSGLGADFTEFSGKKEWDKPEPHGTKSFKVSHKHLKTKYDVILSATGHNSPY
jgi:hypothetical protein